VRVADVTGTANSYVINCDSVYTAWRQTVAKRMTLTSLVEYSHIHMWVNTGMGSALLIVMNTQNPFNKLMFSWISFILQLGWNCPISCVFY